MDASPGGASIGIRDRWRYRWRPRGDVMSDQELLDLAGEFGKAWNDHDLDRAMALVTDDCVFESTGPAPDGERHQGRDAVRAAWKAIFDNVNAQFHTEEIFVTGDRVVQTWRYDWGSGHVRGGDAVTARVPYLNARLQGFGETIFAEMSALALRTGAINLGQGFPDEDGPSEVSRAAVTAIEAGHNQYPPGIGIPELRHAISEHQRRFWGLDYDPDREVLVTAGATEAIAASLLALCDVGDEVLTFEPTYDSYAAGAAMAGATLRVVTLRPPDYRFDV